MLNKIALIVSLVFSSYAIADELVEQCVPEGQWISDKGKRYDSAEIFHSLSQTNVVLLGEDHDNPEHHRWQLQTMAGLYALEPNLALGFEAFPRGTQKILDQWVAGELSEKAFLEAVDWNKIWRFNKADYLPMFHFARMNRIPMYALNVERELVSKVANKGWKNVPEKDREGVSKPADPTQDYIDVLAQVFSQHLPKHRQAEMDDMPELTGDEVKDIVAKSSFQRFLQGQLLWDRAMAEVFHWAITEKDHVLVVGVLGAGHIINDYGVPHQLNALGVTNIKTLMAWDGSIDCQQLRDGAVDVAFGIVEVNIKAIEAEQERPRLGVYLEHNDGVLISRVVKGSVAEKAGVKVGDKVINIAGKSVKKVSDVVDAVQITAFGTWLPMTINREGKELKLVAKFSARSS